MSGATEDSPKPPGKTETIAPAPIASPNGDQPSESDGVEVDQHAVPGPPAGMPEDLRRLWYWEQIRLLRSKASQLYFFMGLTGFGAVAGVALAALGVPPGGPEFYAGSVVSPGIVLGGLWGLIKTGRGGDE